MSDSPNMSMTEQEQQDLMDLIGFDDEQTIQDRAKDWIMFQLNVQLNGGTIELNSNSGAAIIKCVYKELDAYIGIREAAKSVMVDMKLGDFYIEDMYSEATMFKRILMRHEEHEGPLVGVKIEVNPTDNTSDLFVNVRLERTDLVFNGPLIQVRSDHTCITNTYRELFHSLLYPLILTCDHWKVLPDGNYNYH
jgi:hypothetical protein